MVSQPDKWGAPPRRRSARTTAQFEVFSELLVTAERLEREVIELLKGEELSLSQYNILRILRGAGAAGLACGQVGTRLIRHDPDMTRLLDRLEIKSAHHEEHEEHEERKALK